MFAGSLSNRSLWTPERISTALWLDAVDSSTITTIDGKVSEWRDKRTGVVVATQDNSALRPTIGSWGNGQNSIVFDGINTFLALTITFPANHSFFVVARSGIQTSGGSILRTMLGTSTPYGVGALSHSDQELDFFISTGRIARVANSWVNEEKLIVSATYNGSVYTGFKNGILRGSATSSQNLSSAVVRVGADPSSSARHFAGDITDVLIFNSVLSTEDRQKVEGYLAHLRELTANLSADHPFKNYPPRGT